MPTPSPLADASVPKDRRRALAANALAVLLSGGTLICCALPVLFVALGLGSVVAAVTAGLPWLVTLSHYKLWVFAAALLALLAAGVLLYRAGRTCPSDPELARACVRLDRVSRALWWLGLAVWIIAAFVSFAWVPLQKAMY